ncbi:transcriptional regulator [Staphylococcus saprophyticus]|jgi:DNA-binding MarR family transcriptional regulator|uniref:HTH-type transcriptional regulator SarZ n=5 Tax=Staphylococcus saprophyticus TaxID=29385 RepID=Q49WG9_STAS1|nr:MULTISPECIES: MarR family transcriptional regulator [Staphylococcus]CRV23756.1 MarR family transcriptional regulator [Streptococcus equi subsp. equi]AMG20829.1 MarR family transcriptional regulator [Staphylococcus saprophyticus]ASE59745.1 MarR family transcriptional regulator [Staphylococcus saprophyticus]ASF18546.1 MarR family transcriptional regulator [Staphylococcus saprophyticus]MBC2921706.1 MarR family transcriptional regulator [Staphylococcus saprophyticus]
MTSNDYDQMRKEMCYLFYITSKEVVNRFNKYLKQFDISFPNYIVLLYIENDKPIYIKTLCDELYLDSGTISPIIKRLEKKSLIERMRTEEDERRVKVRLTEKGLELKDHFPKISEDVIQQFNMKREDSLAYYEILKTFAEQNIYINDEER